MFNEIEAGQICETAYGAIIDGKDSLRSIPGLLKRIIKEKAWARRKVKMHGIVELPSLRELITRKPMIGWGEDPAKIEALLRDDPEVLAMWREAMKEQGKRNDIHDNIMEVKEQKQGTSRSYTLARLQRVRPDLFEMVKAGKLSANAAAIKAGWRKKKTNLETMLGLWKKLTSDERKQFLKEVGG